MSRIYEDLSEIESLIVGRVLGKEALNQFKSGAISNAKLKAFVPDIVRLSARYNTESGELLSSGKTLAAYSLYFLPLNYMKLRWLLEKTECQLEMPAVLDFGCGPGTGGLAACGHFAGRLQIFLFDAAPQAAKYALGLIKMHSPNVSVNSVSKWQERKYDLIIASNALNEVAPNMKQKLLTELAVALRPGGILLILEPALKDKTRKGMETRDFLVAAGGLTPIFPCTRNGPCPMLRQSNDDWCHGSISWEQSRLTRQIDDLTGFNKHRIKYSAFIFQKNGSLKEGYRVVSLPRKDKSGTTIFLCGESYYGPVKFSKKSPRYKKAAKVSLHSLVGSDVFNDTLKK